MRLDKAISNNSFYTRKEIKRFIKNGYVSVNDNIITDESYNVTEADKVIFDNEYIDLREKIYIIMNKPKGVITALKDSSCKTVIDLIDESYKDRLLAVGRLDKDTTGLLLLTTDGDFVHKVTSPNSNIDKTYEVTLDYKLTEEDIKILEDGITLDGEKLKNSRIEYISNNTYLFTISEGKYHQIKRMAQAVKNNVVELNRIRIGDLELSDLPVGSYRELTNDELNKIMRDA